tara:strand:+ start:52 stop:252 length:201 start_codon:yes stop_codon:yes gene_type:complete
MIGTIISMGVIFMICLLLAASIVWDIFKILSDIKFELEDMNRELKRKNDKPRNYTMKELEAAIKHE